jgi:tetratricopeptide (TPR) repeat protein
LDDRARRRWIALLLFVGAWVLYGRTLGFEFVYDDSDYVVTNPLLARGWSVAALADLFTEFHSANWHPLTWLSHLVDVTWYGLEPGGHHATNVFLHGLAAALCFLALAALGGRTRESAWVAALFLVHPLRVESVAWVSERKDVLAGVFFFLTLLAYAHHARRPGAGSLGLVTLAFLGAALAKPTVVTLPFVLLLLDAWPLRRFQPGTSGRAGRLLLEKLPLLAVSLLIVVTTLRAQSSFQAVSTLTEIPLGVRLLNALASCGAYLTTTVWPAGLAMFYPHPALVEADPVAALLPRAALGAVLVGGGLCLGVALRRRRPEVLVGGLLFLGMLVPMLGLVQVGQLARADRYAYLPLLGVYVALVWPLCALVDARPGLRRGAGLLGAALLAGLGVRTFQQAGTWRDAGTLNAHALAVTEKNFVAHSNLAEFLIDGGDLARGEEHARHALELAPRMLEPHVHLARLAELRGDDAEAVRELRVAASLAPGRVDVLLRLGMLESRSGEEEAAAGTYERVLALDPDETDALYALGVLAGRRGDLARAEARYRDVLARAPNAVDALVNLGDVLMRTGRTEEALVSLRRAASLDVAVRVSLASALESLARAGAEAGRLDAAVRWQEEAVQILAESAESQALARARERLAAYRAGSGGN